MSSHKQIMLPHQRDSMGSFINPTNGYRGELAKKGIAPKNHMKENMRELRLTQLKLKQEKVEKDDSEVRARNLFKLPQFQQVESRLHAQMSKARPEDEDLENENPKFLTRRQSEIRREELVREKKLIRQDLETKFVEETGGISLSERKAPVPKATEFQPVAEPSNANFIHRNKVNAITMSTRKTSEEEEGERKHSEYGKVPQYLEERRARWHAEEEERRRRLPDPDCPPGMCVMSETERMETVRVLQESKEEALGQLRKLPFVIETPSMRKKQEFLENKLRDIDHALSIFSKPKVYVAIDR